MSNLNVPNVEIEELQHALGIQPEGSDEIQLIMGNCSKGPLFTPAPYASIDGLVADWGEGGLVEEGARSIQDSGGTPVYVMRLPNSTPGALGTLDTSLFTGTASPTLVGVPYDEYEGWFKVVSGGIVGDPAADITIQWSLGNGRKPSAVTSFPNQASASAGFETSNAGSFPVALVDGDTLVGKVDQQGSPPTLTVHMTPAAVTGSAATYAAVTSGHKIVVAINGVVGQQQIVFAGTENSQALFHSKFNQQANGARLQNNSGQSQLITNASGSGAGGSIVSGDSDVLASLGLVAGALVNPGPNNVVNDVVTAAEMAGLLTSMFTGGTAGSTGTAIGADRVKWASNTPGGSPKGVQFTSGTIVAKVPGWNTAEHNGTAATYQFTFPRGNVGIVFQAGDVMNDGDILTFGTDSPKWVDGDVTTGFVTVAGGQQSFGFVQIVGNVSGTEATTIGDGLDKLRLQDKFKWAIFGARGQNSGESAAAWAAALIADYASFRRTDVAVTAGKAWVTSAVSGEQYLRHITGSVAARVVSIAVQVDAGKVRIGPIPAITLYDSNQNRIGHDEDKAPLLAAKQFVTMRTFNTRGTEPYINNPLLMSPQGADFVWIQHRRVMNVLEEVVLDVGISLDLGLEGTVDDNGFVSETSARDIESDMRAAIKERLGAAISNPDSQALFVLSRTDPVLLNGGILTGEARIQPLFYVKGMKIKTGFSNTGG